MGAGYRPASDKRALVAASLSLSLLFSGRQTDNTPFSLFNFTVGGRAYTGFSGHYGWGPISTDANSTVLNTGSPSFVHSRVGSLVLTGT